MAGGDLVKVGCDQFAVALPPMLTAYFGVGASCGDDLIGRVRLKCCAVGGPWRRGG
jgi:hypothetical protein